MKRDALATVLLNFHEFPEFLQVLSKQKTLAGPGLDMEKSHPRDLNP